MDELFGKLIPWVLPILLLMSFMINSKVTIPKPKVNKANNNSNEETSTVNEEPTVEASKETVN